MKVVTWNVNSLKARADYVSWYLDYADPDVICLQELKLEDDKVPRHIFEERGYHLETHGQKQWNGVAIAAKQPITNVTSGLPGGDDGQARLIAAEIAGLKFVNLYCPQGQSVDSPKFPYKLNFYKTLRAYISERYTPSDPLVVLGDLNVAPLECDVHSLDVWAGKPSHHPSELEEWAQLLAFGLDDAVWPHIEAGTFTFWDYRGGAFRYNNGMRIDHVLVTDSVMPRVKAAYVDRVARKKQGDMKASDHAPVVAIFDE